MDEIVARTLLNGFMAGLQKKADPLLRDMHKEAMNVGSQHLLGAVDILESLEILTPEGATHWRTVSQVCFEHRPEDPGHTGGRKWCAHCGDLDAEGLPIGSDQHPDGSEVRARDWPPATEPERDYEQTCPTCKAPPEQCCSPTGHVAR